MNGQCLISAVLVTYNRPFSVLMRSLNSILNQTYKNIQITIVDISTDRNVSHQITEYISSLNKTDLQLILLPGVQNNRARNIGFKASKGNYIAFLDDDDEWASDKLEKQLKLFEEGVSIVYSNYYTIDANNNKNAFFQDIPDNNNLKSKILGENVIGCTSMPLISSRAFIEAGGFDETLRANQDWDLWIRILQDNDAIYSPVIAGIKHNSKNSISNNKYRRATGWIGLLIKHSGKYQRNREQLTKATGFFAGEMLSKKMYLTGTAALVFHFLLRGTGLKK